MAQNKALEEAKAKAMAVNPRAKMLTEKFNLILPLLTGLTIGEIKVLMQGINEFIDAKTLILNTPPNGGVPQGSSSVGDVPEQDKGVSGGAEVAGGATKPGVSEESK